MVPIYFYDDAWAPDPAGLNWRGAAPAELTTTSLVVNGAWVRWGASWGKVTGVRVVAWDAHNPIGEADPARDNWPLPAATRSFTVEGRREHTGVVPYAYLLQQAK